MFQQNRLLAIAFFLGFFALIYMSRQPQFKNFKSSEKFQPGLGTAHISEAFHETHIQQASTKKTSKPQTKNPDNQAPKNTHIIQSIEQARNHRARSTREEWDQIKKQYPDLIHYFIDRHPSEVAEELINAHR